VEITINFRRIGEFGDPRCKCGEDVELELHQRDDGLVGLSKACPACGTSSFVMTRTRLT
jgi:hypothetical protein